MPTRTRSVPPSYPEISRGHFPAGPWFVAQTHPQEERVVALHLIDRGVDYYLPMREERRVYRDRCHASGEQTRICRSLVFPSYIFARGGDAPETLWRTNKIITVLRAIDQAEFDRSLANVFHVLSIDPTLSAFEGFAEGVPCRVIRGVWRGSYGKVRSVGKHWKISVDIQTMGRYVEFSFDDPRDVEVIR